MASSVLAVAGRDLSGWSAEVRTGFEPGVRASHTSGVIGGVCEALVRMGSKEFEGEFEGHIADPHLNISAVTYSRL